MCCCSKNDFTDGKLLKIKTFEETENVGGLE